MDTSPIEDLGGNHTLASLVNPFYLDSFTGILLVTISEKRLRRTVSGEKHDPLWQSVLSPGTHHVPLSLHSTFIPLCWPLSLPRVGVTQVLFLEDSETLLRPVTALATYSGNWDGKKHPQGSPWSYTYLSAPASIMWPQTIISWWPRPTWPGSRGTDRGKQSLGVCWDSYCIPWWRYLHFWEPRSPHPMAAIG